MFKIERKTKVILSAVILVSIIGYILSSFGKSDSLAWLFAILGILIGLGVYSEVAVVDYFRQKKFKQIGMGDFIVWIGAIFGTVIILNSIIIINTLRNVTPTWLLNFLSINGAIAGGVTGILLLLMLWLPRPE